jgi:hypothetical protein
MQIENLKPYSKLTLLRILIIHVIIEFNGNHHKLFGWIPRSLWTRNGFLKWQHNVFHIEKMKNLDSKNMLK